MRAHTQAQQAPISATAARAQLGRLAIAVVATVLLLLIWRPTVLRAQSATAKDTTSSTHEVKAGETLWSIATRYYGDGHAWRALARRNGVPTAGEAVIHVGQILVVPAKSTVAAAAAAAAKLPAPAETETPLVATMPAAKPDSATAAKLAMAKASASVAKTGDQPKGSLAAQTAAKADAKTTTAAKSVKAPSSNPTVADKDAVQDASAIAGPSGLRPQVKAERMLVREPSRVGLIDIEALRASRKKSEVPTVFIRQVLGAEEAAEAARLAVAPKPPAPRQGEYNAAPYPFVDSKWQQAGSIMRRVDAVGPSLNDKIRLQLADEIEITIPAGATASVGDRFVAMKDAGLYAADARVGSPTGVVQVIRAEPGQTVRAYIRSQTGTIELGQPLFPLDGEAGRADVKAVRQETPDVGTTVTWVEMGSLLPSLLSHVILSAGASEGVQPGDEFELYGESETPGLSRIAILRVVRVGTLGSSAVVIRQSRQGIAVGAKARRIAKMP